MAEAKKKEQDAEDMTPLSTGDIISRMVSCRDERRRISGRDKELISEWRSLELELLTRLDSQGMKQASTDDGTATITKTTLPNVVDWDALWEHIVDTRAFHLLQRRPAAAAFRELNSSGEKIPGIDAYEQRTISLRKAG